MSSRHHPLPVTASIVRLGPMALVAFAALSCSKQASISSLPQPTGQYGVGSARFSFVDSTRPETFTPDLNDFREVAFRIWYPALKTSCTKRVPYLEKAGERKQNLPKGSPMPPAFFDSLGQLWSNSYYDGVLTGEAPTFPIVIYSAAYGAGIDASTVLMEELTSHGYVAVSVGHAFETSHFIRSDGTLRTFPLDNEELRARGKERAAASDIQRELNETADTARLRTLVRAIAAARPKTLLSLRTWVEDIGFVIDRLAAMNAEGQFKGRLDLGRIGVVGHSFGGAAAGEACLIDPQCRCGVNLDGLQLGGMLDHQLERPFMFVHHDNEGAANKLINLPFFEAAQDTCYMAMVRGTRHLSFSDVSLPVFARITGLPAEALGPINGLRALTITNDLVRSFFDRHLRGLAAPMLDDPAQGYPEMELRTRTPRT
jgi:predicted dienelactone hydrolase